jgi:hypothetical protein
MSLIILLPSVLLIQLDLFEALIPLQLESFYIDFILSVCPLAAIITLI